MHKTLHAALAAATLVVLPAIAAAHCQVPCGIYDDAARIAGMREDVTTIAKAVDNILTLTAATDPLSLNQVVRWIETKETHASHIIETVSTYFLTQKVKPPAAGDDRAAYLESLADHHAVMRAAMRAKQTVSADEVKTLRDAVEKLASHYVQAEAQTRPH